MVDAALAGADGRVWLMLMLGSRHGLRRGEISRVHGGDLVEDLAGRSLLVHGKGGKDRLVPLLPEVAERIGAATGWVFPNGTRRAPDAGAHGPGN